MICDGILILNKILFLKLIEKGKVFIAFIVFKYSISV